MATGIIETIIYKHVKSNSIFGAFPEIEKGDLAPVTEQNNHDRISIRCNASDNTDWQHSFAYVYIYVPNVKSNNIYRKTVRYIIIQVAIFSGFSYLKKSVA